tara:strand:- start:49 stop:819 length:771 start_codon:yes stop_codon:yes gene_type:complete
MNSGIYIIKNTINGKFYIGSAVNIKSRWSQHKHQLKYNKHGNRYLQRSWNKHGTESFVFEVLEYVKDKHKLILCEQKWFDKMKPHDHNIGYNICQVAGSSLGVKHTDEMRAKVSKAVKGRKLSVETKKNMSLSKMREKNPMYGYAYSKEQRKQKSLANTGEKNPFYDKKHTKETREKMSKNGKGKNSGPKTREHIDKITESAMETRRRNSKLDKEKVLEMRRLREKEGWKYTKIAKKFSICPKHASKICRNEIWKF